MHLWTPCRDIMRRPDILNGRKVVLPFTVHSSSMIAMSPAQTLRLDQSWYWKQRALALPSVLDEMHLPLAGSDIQESWMPARTFPSEVHVELLKSGHIPDPFIGFNEHKVQWIGETEWLYMCIFPVERYRTFPHANLTFEGLDTFCDVYLNGDYILSSNNMFQTHVLSIFPPSLRDSNTLLLHFKSAKIMAKVEEAKYGKVRAGSTNLGDPSRVYVRKAQYNWRWDWGPELMTCGPYRPVVLKFFAASIAEVHPRSFVSFDEGVARPSLKVDVTVDGSLANDLVDNLSISLRDSTGRLVKSEDTGTVVNKVTKDIVNWDLKGVDLWWPHNYGEQNLYDLEVTIKAKNGDVLDSCVKRIGFRSVQLIQESLSEADEYGSGTTFLFEVNDVRMFMGGSNWIPADSFLTTITEERYRAWLTLLRDGNQNMVRVWGGGVYEPDIFYDLCDELGILVWQDFQFACGVYPAHDDFVASVKKEAEDNVKRLRHHPCMALFCGNNEDYQMVLQWGGIPELPARKLYEHVLPEVVERLTDPPIPYHRGSPYGGEGWDTTDPTVGDVHQWNIWGGKELPYQDYDKLGGRFVSEFGMPALPSMQTISYWMDGADELHWYSQSPLIAQHTRAGSFERRFAIAMNENFRITEDLERYSYTTQLMQSEAIGYAYQVWRRKWAGGGKEYTSGVLVWQLNDCWPVTSWAIADYFLRKKPAYYSIARQLAPFSVGIFRTVIKNRENDRPRQFYEFGAQQSHDARLEIWASNGTLSAKFVKLELLFHDSRSSWSYAESHQALLQPNQSTELRSMRCPGPPQKHVAPPSGDPIWTSSYSVVVTARLVDDNGRVVARFSDWPQPYRYLQIPDPGLVVKVDGELVTISVERPVKGLFLSVDGPEEEVKWSDNALDVAPGDIQTVIAKGLNGRQIKAAHLGREKATLLQV